MMVVMYGYAEAGSHIFRLLITTNRGKYQNFPVAKLIAGQERGKEQYARKRTAVYTNTCSDSKE